jgi:hypothetical protein
MNERDFAYWLNGFVEMNGGAMPTAAQWKAIQDHLALVFKKVTPPVGVQPLKASPGIDWDEMRQKFLGAQPKQTLSLSDWKIGTSISADYLPGTLIC